MTLTTKQLQRYHYHIITSEIGKEGQEKLSASRVLIIGAGGLGSACSLYLAASGVGKIGIADCDCVELSNLQRQILYTIKDLRKPKAASAKRRLKAFNPDIDVAAHTIKVNSRNISNLVKGYDLVADCTDNFAAKYLVNDYCVLNNKPLFYGSVLKFEGQATTIIPGKTACYRCIFPEMPPDKFIPSCNTIGIFNVVPGIIGILQASEIMKYILGIGGLLTNSLLIFDGLALNFRKLAVHRNSGCRACGTQPP